MKVFLGIDLIEEKLDKKFFNSKVGVLTNPSGINFNFQSTVEVILKSENLKLKAIFGPQHGFTGHTQANMVEWEGFKDPLLKIPIYSLYGKRREPKEEWLSDLNLLIIDLQDIGSRYYTYIWTMALCFKICEKINLPVLVLDRPNPIGCKNLEGFVLKEEFSSFVGFHPLPIRHGMTICEVALYFKENFYKKLDLYIIPMKNYKRSYFFEDTKANWVMPSPNIPTIDTCFLYPGACLLEGTNISEGRGTTKPFEIFGAPFFEERIEKEIRKIKIDGGFLRPLYFQPTFDKYKGEICKGFQVHILNRKSFKPFKTFVSILKIIFDLYEKNFEWKKPPYEYEFEKMPIDILAGTDLLRKGIEGKISLKDMEEIWEGECKEFQKLRKNYLLYK